MVAAVADMFASTRDEEDRFSRAMYQSARTAFMRNIEGALTIRDAQYKQRLKQQRMTADKQMEAARAAFRVELQSRLELQRAELLRRFKAGGVSAAELDDAEAEPPLAAAASSRGFVGGSVAASARTTATALPGGGGGGDEEGQGSKWQEILSQLQASKDDLKAQNDKLQSSVAQLYKEVKSHKATAEAATERAEQVQQECMQIVGACEQHIMQLQTRYLEELAERDMLLKRCKDAIMMLEGQVKALQEGRGSPRGPAASGSSAVTGGTTATTLPGGSPVSPGRSRLSAGGGGAASTAR